jgi:lauroyl/myristoyl acyltransferase
MRLLGNGKALTRLVEVRGLENLRAALAGGKGAILCSAHFGSPMSCFSLVGALGFPVTLIADWSYSKEPKKRLLNKLFHRLKHDMPVSSHLHRPNIERKSGNHGVAVQAAMLLRQNEFVGIMIDAKVKPIFHSRPMAFDFLNGKAILVPGATTIAQLTGAPVMVVLLHRSADWRHQVLEISSPIRVEGDPVTAFKQCLALIEAAIRRYPAQWGHLFLSQLVEKGLVSPEVASLKWRTFNEGAVSEH